METPKAINIDRDVNVHLEDRRKSRAFFLFLWLLYAFVYLTKNCFNSALTHIVTEGLLTKSQTGLFSGVFYLVYTPFQILGGFACDRYSPERLVKLGLLGSALCNAVIFFNQNYYVMLAAWAVNGAVQFAVYPGLFKIISSQLVRSDRKMMIFCFSFATTGGLIFSYLLGAFLSDWRYNFAVSVAILVLFAVALHVVEGRVSPYLKWDAPAASPAEARKVDDAPAVSTGKLFAASGFYFMLIASTITVVVSQSSNSLAPILLVENYESISPTTGNLLNIFMLVSGLAGNIAANLFARRVRNHPRFMGLFHLLLLPFCMLCPFVGRLPVPAMVAILCAIACLFHMVALVRSYYVMTYIPYGKNGAAIGLLNGSLSFSYMLASYAVPRMQESFGWPFTLWSWSAIIAAGIPLYLLGGWQFGRFLRKRK